ncbi:MAG: hypothetical protein II894_01710, partial [Bacteroidales bacterium]|nr:hypothetical protein [Bacteroidales bacterium]
PMFENWTCSGTIIVLDDVLTTDVLQTIWNQAGFYAGLCDWRPGSNTPGQFGRFSATLKEVK